MGAVGVVGLGVAGLSPSPGVFLGAGVDEADDLPLLGLTGSLLAWLLLLSPLVLPFSLGELRFSPFWTGEPASAPPLLLLRPPPLPLLPPPA